MSDIYLVQPGPKAEPLPRLLALRAAHMKQMLLAAAIASTTIIVVAAAMMSAL